MSPTNFLLTQAQDWAMFQFMFSIAFTILGGLLALILGMVVFMWKDLKKQIADKDKELDERLRIMERKVIKICQ